MTEEWFHLWEIRFKKVQIPWLLKYLPLLRDGEWPEANCGNTISRHNRAYFETPAIIAAEMDVRLAACGQDGGMAEAYYTDGKDVWHIARMFDCQVSEVFLRIDRAVAYMGGWKRKKGTYLEWTKHKKHKEDKSAQTM